MCGRFTLRTPAGLLVQHFRIDAPPVLEPRFNIAPTQSVATISIGSTGTRQLFFRRWGLIPSWADDPKIGNRMINARGETVASKPSFRAAFKRRRCLIPADGFYEWKTLGKKKQPYLFHLEGDDLFAFAGLWETWHDEEGSELESTTIITTEANDFMKDYHDRMPVIVDPSDYEQWLDPKIEGGPEMEALLRPAEIDLIADPVSPLVSDSKKHS